MINLLAASKALQVFIPALILLVLAMLFAIALAYLGKKLAVSRDERIDQVRDCLSGANCGACGYDTCRQKAWAVANGFADVEMCLPYVRERAESMSNEVIMNSPNGIVVIDYDLKIQDINRKGMELWGIDDSCKGNNLVDYFNPTDFILAISENKNLVRKKVKVDKTGKYAEMHIVLLPKHKVMFAKT